MVHRLFLALLAGAVLTTPAAAQERVWALDVSGEDAFLVFGVPDTEDVGISLWCPIQQGEVNVFVPEAASGLRAGKSVKLTIGTDDRKAEFTGRTEVNPDAGVVSIELQIKAGDPIFESMLHSDRFYVKATGEENVFPLYDADLAGLIELCRKPS
jgi:hypothetical protein